MSEQYRVLAGRIHRELEELGRVVTRAERALEAARQRPEDQDLYLDSAPRFAQQSSQPRLCRISKSTWDSATWSVTSMRLSLISRGWSGLSVTFDHCLSA